MTDTQIIDKTAWFSQAKYGLFVHFLPSGTSFQAEINAFNVDEFAEDCAEAGVGYVIWTLGQNSGYFCAPNSVYDSYAGRRAGATCSLRDLPSDLIDALGKRRIAVMLYVPGDIPAFDREAAEGLGGRELLQNFNGENWVFNDMLVERWGNVLREWSVRYGDRIGGWWLDGCYRESGFTDEHAAALAYDLRHGHPKSIVAFNTGINFDKVSDSEDYLAGEANDLLSGICASRFVDGAQWHELSFLGARWGAAPPRYAADQIIDHLRTNILPHGGVLSIDVSLTGSRIESDSLRLLAAVKKAIRQ